VEKSVFYFKKIYWKDVRDEVRVINPKLAEIIDKISPDKNYPLIKASYRFGDLIVNNGTAFLPDKNGDLLSIKDPVITNVLKNQLSYSPIPLFLTLKNASEVFINSSFRAIPLNLFYPGSLLGLFESIDYLFDRSSSSNWCVSAGARNLFFLAKINEIGGFKRLKMEFEIDSTLQPRTLADHWRLFREIAQQDDFKQSWCNEVLFFTKPWFFNHRKDSSWFAFKEFLFKEAWHQAQFAISKVGLNLTWEYFSRAISARNLKPIPYLVDQVKHILLVGAGRWPGFRPSDTSDLIAPVDGLQNVFTDVYMLKKHLPTIMHTCSLERTFHVPSYYSLSYPTLLEGSPQSKSPASTIMIDLRDIKQIIDTLKPVFKDHEKIDGATYGNINFEYFHVEKDKYGEIKMSNDLALLDKNLIHDKHKYPDRDFCATSQFWRGCIKIVRDKPIKV